MILHGRYRTISINIQTPQSLILAADWRTPDECATTVSAISGILTRSEERRVGKECRCRRSRACWEKKKEQQMTSGRWMQETVELARKWRLKVVSRRGTMNR